MSVIMSSQIMKEVARPPESLKPVASDNSEADLPPSRAPVVGEPVSLDLEERTVEIILSTCARDRQGDIIEPGGLDFENYLKNPVVLWAHDLSQPPVGKVLSVEVVGGEARAKVKFAETDFAREVFELYAEGFLRAWSVGFIPRRYRRLENGEAGFHVMEAEVVEISAVPVPANPEALTRRLEAVHSKSLRSAFSDIADDHASGEASANGVRISARQLSGLASALVSRLAEESVRCVVKQASGSIL